MTDWRIKAVFQQLVSAAPGGAKINFLLQRHLTHGVPVTDALLPLTLQNCREHVQAYDKFAEAVPLNAAVFYEFGSGWDLHIPLAFFALGVNQQVTIDVRRHARADLMRDIIQRLPALLETEEAARFNAVSVDPTSDDAAELGSAYGIDYRAPSDARATGLPDGSVHCVTSTSTLEHVPAEDIAAVLLECRRVLAPGGICSFIIDPGDHFSRFDRSIASNNFLRYSKQRWRLLNPPLAFQNRLRYPDYLGLVEQAGFEVLSDSHRVPGRRALPRGLVNEEFQHFSDEELAISFVHLVLRPA